MTHEGVSMIAELRRKASRLEHIARTLCDHLHQSAFCLEGRCLYCLAYPGSQYPTNLRTDPQ